MAATRLVKLRLDQTTARLLADWQVRLAGVWNWALRRIEADVVWYRIEGPRVAEDVARRRWRDKAEKALADGAPLPAPIDPATCHPRKAAWLERRLFTALNGHARSDIPIAVLRQTAQAALRAWLRAKTAEQAWWAEGGPSSGRACPRVRRKGARRPLDWLGADGVRVDLSAGTISFPGLVIPLKEAQARQRKTPAVRFFRHGHWPTTATGQRATVAGTVRLLCRPRGWYAALVFKDAATPLPKLDANAVPILGADLGFAHVVTLSDGTVYDRNPVEDRLRQQLPKASRRESPHPHHQATRTAPAAKRADTAARRTGRVARLQQRMVTARQWRNREIVRKIQAKTEQLILLEDTLPGLQRMFGRSVLRQALGDLVTRLRSSARPSGSPTGTSGATGRRRWQVDGLPGAYSTSICPACQARTGPTGWAQMSIRSWTCGGCGVHHPNRDQAAAQNAVVWWCQPRYRPSWSGPRRSSIVTSGSS